MRNHRGSLLIFSYLFTACLALWLSTTFVRSTAEVRGSDRYADTTQAFQLAEAAADLALARLRSGAAPASIASTALSGGTYSATVTASTNPVGLYTIIGTGAKDNVQQQIEVVVQQTGTSPYRWGIFGLNEVQVRGSVETDSYNSSRGTYAQTRSNKGDIGTNGTGHGKLEINGSAYINGKLIAGPGADLNRTIILRGSAIVTGGRMAASQAASFPLPSPPQGVSCGQKLRLRADETLTLSAGTYCYDGVDAAGQATIVTTGAVTIFSDGDIDLRGGSFVGSNSTPANLTIKVCGHHNVRLNGSMTFVGVLYNPGAYVRINGSATVYGAIVGREVRVDGSAAVHYDEALNNESGSTSSQFTIRSWRTL